MAAPTTGTPLEIAQRYREEETKKLMGFGENSPLARQDLAVMQEVQNLFNAHKTTGARLLQAGKISTEEYYQSTRQAGIKLGIIGEDEYPDNLPDYLKPTLEIGGAVIGGVIGGLAGLPGGVGGSLAGESVGAGLGSATGTAAFALLQDFTAPDAMPTSSWEDRGVGEEALKEGLLVAGLTAGIGGVINVGRSAIQNGKISTKAIDRLAAKGRDGINSILGSKTAQKLNKFKNGYLIEEQQKADDLMIFLKEQGITPNLSMIIDNDTVRSLIYALGRTPILGTPAREAYDLAKNELFERIAYGVQNDNLEKALAPLTDKFIKDGKGFRLKDGIKLEQVDDMGSVVNFINYSAIAQKNIKTLYDDAEKLIGNQKYNLDEQFAKTKSAWNNFTTQNVGLENYSKNGRTLKSLLSRETNEMADILFGQTAVGVFSKQRKLIAEKYAGGKELTIQITRGPNQQPVSMNLTEDALNHLNNKYIEKLSNGNYRLTKDGDLDLVSNYSKESIDEVLNASSKTNLDKLTPTGKAFKNKNISEQLVIFKRQLDSETAESAFYSSRVSATRQDLVFHNAIDNLRKQLGGDLIGASETSVANKLRQADEAFVLNKDRIRNSTDLIKRVGYYQFNEAGQEAAKLLSKSTARNDVLSQPLNMGKIDKNGDLLDNAFKTRQVTTTDGRVYFEYLKDANGQRVKQTVKEQLQVPGISPKVLDDIVGTDSVKSGDVVVDLFTNGTPAQLKNFKTQ